MKSSQSLLCSPFGPDTTRCPISGILRRCAAAPWKQYGGMSKDLGHTGTRWALGAKRHRPLYGVSSMLLKGAVRRRQVSEKQCLAERCHGDSQEACIVLRGTSPL